MTKRSALSRTRKSSGRYWTLIDDIKVYTFDPLESPDLNNIKDDDDPRYRLLPSQPQGTIAPNDNHKHCTLLPMHTAP